MSLDWTVIVGSVATAFIVQAGFVLVGYFKMSTRFEYYSKQLAATAAMAERNERDLVRANAQIIALKETISESKNITEENFAKIESQLENIYKLLIENNNQNRH